MSDKNPFPNKDRKALLMTLLKIMGGRKVEVGFSGGGDSGEIEGASLLDQDGHAIDLKGAAFDWHESTSRMDEQEGKWVYETKVVPNMPIDEILVKITEDALEESGLDWYNNDGGSGSLTIDLMVDPPTINLSVGINYTETNWHDFDYTDNEKESEEEDECKG